MAVKGHHAKPPFKFPEEVDPYVSKLVDIVGYENLDQAVKNAYDQGITQMTDWEVNTAERFLLYASGTLRWIPCENENGTEIYYTLLIFYFVLDQDPIHLMQTPISPKSIDMPLSPVSQWINGFAIRVGDFMDTEESLTEESLGSFDEEHFNMSAAIPPDGGFKTFNQLFCRRIDMKDHPIAAPEDPSIITWPADSKYDGQWPINKNNSIEILPSGEQTENHHTKIKGIPWPIDALLATSKFKDAFVGGTWMHAFLGPTDYHRQHAPVAGTVVEAKVIQGQCYLETSIVEDSKGRRKLEPHRTWRRHQDPKKALDEGDGRDPEAPDKAGYQFLQTRGCIVIKNDVVGLVAVLPIGMAYVSSVKLSVKDIYDTGAEELPTKVTKGQEISCFQFGGSDIVLCFQKGIKIVDQELNKHHLVGEVLAVLAAR